MRLRATRTGRARDSSVDPSSSSLFASENFRRLWIANALFFASQQIALIALQWLILDLGGSKTLLGLAALIQGVTVFLLSPIGGVLAERSSRRNLLILGRTGLSATTVGMGGLLLLGRAEIWIVLLGVCVASVFLAVVQPATQTFVYDVVGPRQLASAIATNASAASLFNMIGPAIGGTLIAIAGVAGAYFMGAFGYLVGVLLVVAIPITGRTANTGRASMFRDVAEGLTYVRRSPLSLWLLAIVSMNLFGGFVILLRPVYAREVLGVGAEGLGLLGLSFGAGAILASVLLSFFIARLTRPGLALIGSLVIWDVGSIVFALSTNFLVSILAQFFMGTVGPIYLTVTLAILQVTSPAALRSRVMSVYFMATQSVFIGQFLAGFLADQLGNVWPLLLAAGVRLVFLIGVLVFARPIRDFVSD